MRDASGRSWLGYVAILINAGAYLDFVNGTVYFAIWRKTGSLFGEYIAWLGWEPAFLAIDGLVILWLLAATTLLFIRRAFAHQAVLLTNLFLIPTFLIPLMRHYHVYQKYIDPYPASIGNMRDSYETIIFRGCLLLTGVLLLLIPSVRAWYFASAPSSRCRGGQVAVAAAVCIVLTAAAVYVRAPW
jgi:uncharacterized membrane protein YozB (DUF420 family)